MRKLTAEDAAQVLSGNLSPYWAATLPEPAGDDADDSATFIMTAADGERFAVAVSKITE